MYEAGRHAVEENVVWEEVQSTYERFVFNRTALSDHFPLCYERALRDWVRGEEEVEAGWCFG